ncbi:MAG TPA: S9 family peptidase, partial [Erythrobacter sp.]|nr:S9 family peptidase [Erythrobacter sp.]
MTTSHALLFAAALLAAPATAHDHGPAAPPMQAQDLVTMPRLGAAVTSPEGQLAIYRVTRTDPETYARSGEWYVIDLANPEAGSVRLDLG